MDEYDRIKKRLDEYSEGLQKFGVGLKHVPILWGKDGGLLDRAALEALRKMRVRQSIEEDIHAVVVTCWIFVPLVVLAALRYAVQFIFKRSINTYLLGEMALATVVSFFILVAYQTIFHRPTNARLQEHEEKVAESIKQTEAEKDRVRLERIKTNPHGVSPMF